MTALSGTSANGLAWSHSLEPNYVRVKEDFWAQYPGRPLHMVEGGYIVAEPGPEGGEPGALASDPGLVSLLHHNGLPVNAQGLSKAHEHGTDHEYDNSPGDDPASVLHAWSLLPPPVFVNPLEP